MNSFDCIAFRIVAVDHHEGRGITVLEDNIAQLQEFRVRALRNARPCAAVDQRLRTSDDSCLELAK